MGRAASTPYHLHDYSYQAQAGWLLVDQVPHKVMKPVDDLSNHGTTVGNLSPLASFPAPSG